MKMMPTKRSRSKTPPKAWELPPLPRRVLRAPPPVKPVTTPSSFWKTYGEKYLLAYPSLGYMVFVLIILVMDMNVIFTPLHVYVLTILYRNKA